MGGPCLRLKLVIVSLGSDRFRIYRFLGVRPI